MSVYFELCEGCTRVQRKRLDPLELEPQAHIISPMWLLGISLGPPPEHHMFFATKAISLEATFIKAGSGPCVTDPQMMTYLILPNVWIISITNCYFEHFWGVWKRDFCPHVKTVYLFAKLLVFSGWLNTCPTAGNWSFLKQIRYLYCKEGIVKQRTLVSLTVLVCFSVSRDA